VGEEREVEENRGEEREGKETDICPLTAPPLQQYALPPQSHTASAIPTSTSSHPEQQCHFDGCPRMIRDCLGQWTTLDVASAKRSNKQLDSPPQRHLDSTLDSR
jgi:hypothetical protein